MQAAATIKSVSVEDLGSIIKQMINGAFENNAQIAKLHQAFYEEWYFNKLAELQAPRSKETQKYPNQDVEQDNAVQNYNLHEINESMFVPKRSHNLIVKVKSTELKTQSQTFHNGIKNCKFNSLVVLREGRTSAEIKENTKPLTKCQNIGTDDYIKSDVEIIEVWNKNPRKKKSDKDGKYNFIKANRSIQDNQKKIQEQNKQNQLAFEVWKKQKNIMYKQMQKQEQKQRQEQLEAKIAEMESKRAAQTYIRMRKQQATQQQRKLSKETRAIEQMNLKLQQKQAEMKRIMNNKVFKEWKRQKDLKLKEQKMINNAYQQYANHLYQQQQQQQQQLEFLNHVQGIDTKFNSWLNQLDWVLHEKYLRERRYLVRSFYCQPAYYGNAADIVYPKRS